MPKNDTFVSVSMVSRGLDVRELKRSVAMKGLRAATKIVRTDARSLFGRKIVSKPGEIPGMVSGKMRRAVKVHSAKRRDRLWSKVQIDTLPGEKMWYPGALFYGRKDGSLKPRKNAIIVAMNNRAKQLDDIIENAIIDAMPIK